MGKTLSIQNVNKSFTVDGQKVDVLKDINLEIREGEFIAIVGHSGCGKSTLLKILAKDLEPDSGMVIHGDTVKIAYFRQGCEEMDLSKKVIEYITDTKNEIKTLEGTYSASQMLERFLFDSKMQYTPIGRLSGGERRRLYLLKVLMQEPNILFLDEPTNDLDIATLQILEDYLDNFPGAVIVVSHDRYFLDRICDKLFVFQNGSINQFIGGYSALMELGKQEKEVKEKKKGTKVQVIPRMTSKEKQELEEMEEKTSSLSEQLELIDEEMNQAGDDFTLIQELADKRAVMEKELEALMERWLYLEEKKEEIEEAKRK